MALLLVTLEAVRLVGAVGGTTSPVPFNVVMGTTLHAGASLSILARFDATDLLDMLRRDRLTMMSGVPTMWNALLHAAGDDVTPADFASLRLAASGGAAMPAEVMRAFEERFGAALRG